MGSECIHIFFFFIAGYLDAESNRVHVKKKTRSTHASSRLHGIFEILEYCVWKFGVKKWVFWWCPHHRLIVSRQFVRCHITIKRWYPGLENRQDNGCWLVCVHKTTTLLVFFLFLSSNRSSMSICLSCRHSWTATVYITSSLISVDAQIFISTVNVLVIILGVDVFPRVRDSSPVFLNTTAASRQEAGSWKVQLQFCEEYFRHLFSN